MKLKLILKSIKKKLLINGILISKPITLNVFTTNECNFSCYYCSRNVKEDSLDANNKYLYKSEFSKKELILLLDKYPTIKIISFVGIGEPFLAKDIITMAKIAKERGKIVQVVTNGSILNKYWGEIAPFFDQVSISLHGLNEEELWNISRAQKEVYSQLIENIHYLIKEERHLNPDIKVMASVVVLKENLNRVERAVEFCIENSIPELDLQNYLPIGPEGSSNCIFDDEIEYIDIIAKLINRYEGKLKINPPSIIKRDNTKIRYNCTTFFNHLRVDGLGNVSGCSRIMPPSKENGNFIKEKNVWQNEYFKEMRKKFKSKKNLPECCRYCPEAQ